MCKYLFIFWRVCVFSCLVLLRVRVCLFVCSKFFFLLRSFFYFYYLIGFLFGTFLRLHFLLVFSRYFLPFNHSVPPSVAYPLPSTASFRTFFTSVSCFFFFAFLYQYYARSLFFQACVKSTLCPPSAFETPPPPTLTLTLTLSPTSTAKQSTALAECWSTSTTIDDSPSTVSEGVPSFDSPRVTVSPSTGTMLTRRLVLGSRFALEGVVRGGSL